MKLIPRRRANERKTYQNNGSNCEIGDEEYRVSLKLKEGDKFTYAKFTKQVMNENLKMFEDCTM
jgi:hypothetical protein